MEWNEDKILAPGFHQGTLNGWMGYCYHSISGNWYWEVQSSLGTHYSDHSYDSLIHAKESCEMYIKNKIMEIKLEEMQKCL